MSQPTIPTWAAQTWTKVIIAVLFEPEERRHKTTINELIIKNNELIEENRGGFNYLGVDFGHVSTMYRGTKKVRIPSAPLAVELFPLMAQHLAYRRQVETDKKLITQSLHRLLQPCVASQDTRDALPEGVVALVPELAVLDRINEVAWTLRDDPRALRQFKKTLPKIEAYCAIRLIY